MKDIYYLTVQSGISVNFVCMVFVSKNILAKCIVIVMAILKMDIGVKNYVLNVQRDGLERNVINEFVQTVAMEEATVLMEFVIAIFSTKAILVKMRSVPMAVLVMVNVSFAQLKFHRAQGTRLQIQVRVLKAVNARKDGYFLIALYAILVYNVKMVFVVDQ